MSVQGPRQIPRTFKSEPKFIKEVGRKKKPTLSLDTATKRFRDVVPKQKGAKTEDKLARDVVKSHEDLVKMTAVEESYRSPPPLPPVPTDPHPTLVSVEDVQERLLDCTVAAHAAGKRITEAGKLGRVVQDIADAFMARKADLIHHTPSSKAPSLASPGTETTTRPLTLLSPNAIPLTQTLTNLHKSVCALTYQLHYYKTHTLPLPGTKKRKLFLLYIDMCEAWRDLMIQLTLSIAQNSSDAASSATGNVAKLAVATGAPDWQDLTIDDAQKLFLQGDKYLLGFGVIRSYDIAFKRYMAAAKFGLPEAINMLGLMFEHGLGRPKDMAAAIKWYQQSANKAHPESLTNMARIHETGKGVPTDPKTAYELYLLAAEAGHLDAMCSLGNLLETGSGCTKNAAEAVRWYRVAAEQDCPRAQNALGSAYYRGIGVAKDYGEAVVWYRRAAECGDPNAHNNLGICYEEGLGVAKDVVMAKTLYKLAAEARHSSGVNNLGYLCMTENNFMEAIRLFHLALSLGSIDAAYNLGILYETGCRDGEGAILNPDWEMASRYYKEAADKNSIKAQLRLANLLTTAPPPLQSYSKAVHYLTIAATSTQEGNPEAQNMLGEMVELGLGTAESGPDHATAAKWYRRAMRQGHARATFNLAALFEAGVGVGRDVEKALRLYEEAELRGSPHARERIQALKDLGLVHPYG
ncbi:hypothetical protein SpCBS45565_g03874 [Spizellomyces sp. 'palustris']|nr:hypothetical protein SpCBS45565_g03874 [Spizellomyces sp. 'palustris']